ncbi:MAG: 1,4-alpha-glucan branching enzyme, partial [Oscillospiraceae bacterium]
MDGNFMQEFLAGRSFCAYEYFGVHRTAQNGTEGYVFRVYAPNAARVELMGEFSNWIRFDMNRDRYGVYSVFCADALPGHIYKYVITDKRGRSVEKSDPYGVYMETPPASGSVVYDIDG